MLVADLALAADRLMAHVITFVCQAEDSQFWIAEFCGNLDAIIGWLLY